MLKPLSLARTLGAISLLSFSWLTLSSQVALAQADALDAPTAPESAPAAQPADAPAAPSTVSAPGAETSEVVAAPTAEPAAAAPSAVPAPVAPLPVVAPQPAAPEPEVVTLSTPAAAPTRDSVTSTDEADARVPLRRARAELAIVQTLFGAGVGLELCILADCGEPRTIAADILVGGIGGAAISLLATRKDGISEARAQVVNAGAMYGTFLGGSLYALHGGDGGSARGIIGTIMAGQAVGIGAGLLLDSALKPTPGEVSLANSAALWTSTASFLALGVIDHGLDDASRRRFFGTTLATSGLALIAGGYLAKKQHVSRGRALLVDLGAITGGGAAPLVAWLIGGDSTTSKAFFGSAMGGVLVGAVGAYIMTRNWDLPRAPNMTVSMSPVQGGALAQVSMKL